MNLGKYYARRFLTSIWAMIIVIVPILILYHFLNKRWAIVAGIIGFIVYCKTYNRIMKNVKYELLNSKQKKICNGIGLGVILIVIILSFFRGINGYVRLILYAFVIGVIDIGFVRMGKNG